MTFFGCHSPNVPARLLSSTHTVATHPFLKKGCTLKHNHKFGLFPRFPCYPVMRDNRITGESPPVFISAFCREWVIFSNVEFVIWLRHEYIFVIWQVNIIFVKKHNFFFKKLPHPWYPFYLRRSRQVLERWEQLLLLGGLLWGHHLKSQGQLFCSRPSFYFCLPSSCSTINFLCGGICQDQSWSAGHWPDSLGGGIHIQISKKRLSLIIFFFGVGSRALSFTHKGIYNLFDIFTAIYKIFYSFFKKKINVVNATGLWKKYVLALIGTIVKVPGERQMVWKTLLWARENRAGRFIFIESLCINQ